MTDLAEEALVHILHHTDGTITRQSTCLHFRLGRSIRCNPCDAFYCDLIVNPSSKRSAGTENCCECPWDIRFKSHRLTTKRLRYNSTWKHITETRANAIQGTTDLGTPTASTRNTTTCDNSLHYPLPQHLLQDVVLLYFHLQ